MKEWWRRGLSPTDVKTTAAYHKRPSPIKGDVTDRQLMIVATTDGSVEVYPRRSLNDLGGRTFGDWNVKCA